MSACPLQDGILRKPITFANYERSTGPRMILNRSVGKFQGNM